MGVPPRGKKRKTQKTRKAWQRKHVVASLHQTKVREWPSEPSNYEESIGANRQNILRTEERGLLNVWTDFNRNSDSESPDDLIPNNILRAQTTRNVQHLLLLQFAGIRCSTSVWSLWDSRAALNKRPNMKSIQFTTHSHSSNLITVTVYQLPHSVNKEPTNDNKEIVNLNLSRFTRVLFLFSSMFWF